MRQTEELCVGILVRNQRGQDIFGSDMLAAGVPLIAPLGPNAELMVRVGLRANLAAGEYFFTAALARGDGTKHDVRFDALMVEVELVRGLYYDTVVNLEPSYEVVAGLPDRRPLMAE
jgi:hypothetical protein